MNKLIVLYDTTTGLILSQGSKDGSWSVVASGKGRVQGASLNEFDLSQVLEGDQVVVTMMDGKRYFGEKDGKVHLPEDVSTRLAGFPVIPNLPPAEVVDEEVDVEVRRWSSECSWSVQERIDAVASKEEELGEDTVGSIVVNTAKAGVDSREWKVDLDTFHLVRRDDFQYE
jgi:co-chaperonin GroES (HSP10)